MDISGLNDEQKMAVLHKPGTPAAVIAGAGSGKCLGRGTPVLLHDGSIRPVEKVGVGDLLMGPDSSPRRVISLAQGREKMYRVIPVKGDPFECNESHILALRNTTKSKQGRLGVSQNTSIKDYLASSMAFKKCFKLYRTGVDFPHPCALPVDPYLLGLWLGDGSSDLSTFLITTKDKEIVEYLAEFCKDKPLLFKDYSPKNRCPGVTLKMTGKKREVGGAYNQNPLCKTMRELFLHNNKHIPLLFKTAERGERLKLLAGLVDSDGYVYRGGCEIATKFEALARDIAFLARSLGFACYIKHKEKTCMNNGVTKYYYILSISGDLSVIPVLLPRKRASVRKQIKSVLSTGFTIQELEEGDYFGFEITGDGRFLLGDFTVTHNTRVLTTRIGYLVEDEGVIPKRILGLTFTNKAANEIKERLSMTDEHNCPRVGTIHSLALSAIRKAPKGFGLNEKVTPLDDYDQTQMFKRLIEAEKLEEQINLYLLKEKIGYHRARGVGFVVDYTADVAARASIEHGGYHRLLPEELGIWKAYEKEKTKNSVVDFDDMIHLVVRRGLTDEKWLGHLQRQFDFVMMDEAQDSNKIQWDFINMLLPPDNLNMLCVGDPGQCQPPGTKVKVVVAPPRVGKAAVCEERNIEDLRAGDKVVAWSKHDQITYSAGREIQVASRVYEGRLTRISTARGTTECTPNHWNWVRFNKNTSGKYLVYLMYRSDLGFRVGLSVFKRGMGAYGLSVRMNQEKAERGWILRVCDSRPEAEAWEEVYSLNYGVAESVFEPHGCRNKTVDLIRLIFSYANPEGGFRCLSDHGLLFDYPITQGNRAGKSGEVWRGYFKTAAANLIPEIMDIPIEGRNLSVKIEAVTHREFKGLVYSLDVEKDHTYLADGLVVGNSIYGFNGAEPEILLDYTKGWRGVRPTTYKLQRNHRSVPEIVGLANKTQLFMSDTIPLKMESHRGVSGERGKVTLRRGATPRELAASVAEDIMNRGGGIRYRDISILVRAGSQVRDIETELVRLRIPYIIRGTMGLLQTEEVKDILSYMKLASNPHDFSAMCRSIAIPKRGIGEAALKALHRDSAQFKGDLIKTIKNRNAQKLNGYVAVLETLQEKFKDPFGAIDYLLGAIRYEEYVKVKYKKHPERIEVKQSNIQRLKELVDSLMSEREMTIEDVVFQLTMQDQKDDVDKAGKVVISTIHASKGLEWHTVYLMGLYEGSLPHKWSSSEKEYEEERRLFYVGCTRARDNLVLCVPATVEYYNKGAQFVAPSRYLTELEICK